MFSEKTGIRVDNYCVTGNTDEEPPRFTLYLDTEPGSSHGCSGCHGPLPVRKQHGIHRSRTMHELACAEIFHVRQNTFSDYRYFCQAKGARMEQSKLIRVLTREDQITFFYAVRENA